jgi:putative copper export protein
LLLLKLLLLLLLLACASAYKRGKMCSKLPICMKHHQAGAQPRFVTPIKLEHVLACTASLLQR